MSVACHTHYTLHSGIEYICWQYKIVIRLIGKFISLIFHVRILEIGSKLIVGKSTQKSSNYSCFIFFCFFRPIYRLESLELKLDINYEQNCDISKYLEKNSWQNKWNEGRNDFPNIIDDIINKRNAWNEKRKQKIKWIRVKCKCCNGK